MLLQDAHRLRNLARVELKRFRQEQLAKQLKDRHTPGVTSKHFWNHTKKHFRDKSASLRGLLLPTGEQLKEPLAMAEVAADYYESLFDAPPVMRPHPYVDAPAIDWHNAHDQIPPVTYPEVLKVLATRKKNAHVTSMASHHFSSNNCLDIIGISSFLCIIIRF